jgi:hypothetical protein
MIDGGLAARAPSFLPSRAQNPRPAPTRPAGDVRPARIETAHGRRRGVQQEAGVVPRTESATTDTTVAAMTPGNALAHDPDPLLDGKPPLRVRAWRQNGSPEPNLYPVGERHSAGIHAGRARVPGRRIVWPPATPARRPRIVGVGERPRSVRLVCLPRSSAHHVGWVSRRTGRACCSAGPARWPDLVKWGVVAPTLPCLA